MTCTHLRREHLIIGTRWFLENVRQEEIDMTQYANKCGTSGCLLGHIGTSRVLKTCGFYYNNAWKHGNDLGTFLVLGQSTRGFSGKVIRDFFGLSVRQAESLFSPYLSPLKADILWRVRAVLQQPSPYDEPQLANLDEEWKEMQEFLVDPSASQVRPSDFQSENVGSNPTGSTNY